MKKKKTDTVEIEKIQKGTVENELKWRRRQREGEKKPWKIQRRDDIAEQENKESAPAESDEDNKRPQKMRKKVPRLDWENIVR